MSSHTYQPPPIVLVQEDPPPAARGGTGVRDIDLNNWLLAVRANPGKWYRYDTTNIAAAGHIAKGKFAASRGSTGTWEACARTNPHRIYVRYLPDD